MRGEDVGNEKASWVDIVKVLLELADDDDDADGEKSDENQPIMGECTS